MSANRKPRAGVATDCGANESIREHSTTRQEYPKTNGTPKSEILDAVKIKNDSEVSDRKPVIPFIIDEPALSPLSRFALNGSSKAMRAKMMADVFILGRLALKGQITYFYAPPNSGKTLITMKLLRDAVETGLDGSKIFYINADDGLKGLTEKLEIAEEVGFMMLAPGHSDFSYKDLERVIKQMIADGTVDGAVLIVDTLKKFIDLMDKRSGQEWGRLAREFTSNGGTIIGHAHTNKRRDGQGKLIHGGTSDLVDDCDCTYMLDVEQDDSNQITTFRNVKNRGDVALEVSYKFDRRTTSGYRQKLDSVRTMNETEIGAEKARMARRDSANKHKAVIEDIKAAIREGAITQKEIKAACYPTHSDRCIRDVLKAHSGPRLHDFQFWSESRLGGRNALSYSLN